MDAGGKAAVRVRWARRQGWICAGLILAAAALWAGSGAVSDADDPPGMVQIKAPASDARSASLVQSAAALSPLHAFELHGIGLSPAPAALLAQHGEAPRWVRQGDVVRGAVLLASVARGHVILADGDQRLRIDLPQRLGGSGEVVPAPLRGLRPEPQPPSGERSAAELAVGASMAGEPPTPEEREAARLGQLPGAEA